MGNYASCQDELGRKNESLIKQYLQAKSKMQPVQKSISKNKQNLNDGDRFGKVDGLLRGNKANPNNNLNLSSVRDQLNDNIGLTADSQVLS